MRAAHTHLAAESRRTHPARGDALYTLTPPDQAPTERHWFVDDPAYPGFCAACALPRRSSRHVERAA